MLTPLPELKSRKRSYQVEYINGLKKDWINRQGMRKKLLRPHMLKNGGVSIRANSRLLTVPILLKLIRICLNLIGLWTHRRH